MVRFFQAVFGWFPGGLTVMAVLVCAFFTTFTGASGVTILALGGLLAVILEKAGYPKRFTVGTPDRLRAASDCSSRRACRSSSTA